MKLRVVVVDDEEAARTRLGRFLRDEPEVDRVHELDNGEDAVRVILSHQPDLVFLDIQMPVLSGFDVIERVGAATFPPTVFVTAHEGYAIRAFENSAVDYLLKPFDRERFRETFGRVRERLRTIRDAALLPGLLAALDRTGGGGAGAGRPGRLVVREGENFRVLPLSRVRYITADGHNVNLHTAEGTYSMRRGMTALEAQLDPEQFIRVHRSTIVNLDAVRRIRPWFAGDCLLDLDDGTELRLSRNYRERLARFSLNES